MEKKIFITGMSCGHCSGRVQKALLALSGTEKAEVSHETGTAIFIGSATNEEITAAIENAGYEVTEIK